MPDHKLNLTGFRLIALVLIFCVTFSLRFINLGYSEFQDDEKKAIIRVRQGSNVFEFFMQQRKGPMQFLVSSIPLSMNGWDTTDEFFIRLPFAIIGTLSACILYLLLLKITNNLPASLVATLLFSTNGFFVGFGRIAQYQNLNLFFSFLSLLFFSFSTEKGRKVRIWSNLGTLSWCLSLLSHWDAVFFLVPIFYYVSVILSSREFDKVQKLKYIISNLVTALLILVPFLIPYLLSQASNDSNISYLGRRVGLSEYGLEKHKYIFELYNPIITLYVYPALALLALFKFRRSWIYFVWLILNFTSIFFFMSKPGTHIYNYVIPVIFLIAIGLSYLKSKWSWGIVILPLLALTALLYYQSHRLFVDNSPEYPWYSKEIINYHVAPEYVGNEVLTFGFPHNRNWKYISEVIRKDAVECRYYISNEGKEISEIYMSGIKYKSVENKTCYYIVKVKDGFIFNRDDTRYPEEIGRSPIYSYYKNGKKVVDLYKVDRRPKDNASI